MMTTVREKNWEFSFRGQK